MVAASAANAQADQQEQMAQWNAARQREQAAWAQSKGALDAYQKEREGREKAAEARAAQAQGGLDTTTGSPLLLQQKFASETMWQSNVVMANADKEKSDWLNKASITEYEGKVKADALRSQAGASLLSGFAGAAKGIGGAFAGGGGGWG